jgi:hypothetical protein
MEDLSKLLPLLLKQMDDNEPLREAVVFATWRRIAGEGLREHTAPVRLYQKHLVIAVTSERWEKYLRDLSGQMIFRLDAALGQPAVSYIEFRVDEDAVLESRRNRGVTGVDADEFRELALEKITPQMRSQADAIKDDLLRYEFLLAAGSCLARKETLTARGRE